jgi:hypothetical protein
MSKAKKTHKYIIENIEALAGKLNGDLYRERFKGMSDKDFDEWFKLFLADEKDVLNIMVPSDGSVDISYEHNLKLASKYGVDFFERLTYKNEDGSTYKATIKSFIVDAFIRVPSQTAEKASAVSDTGSVNPLSGQMRTASKITAPENGILMGLGLKETMQELNRFRGGGEELQMGLRTLLAKKGEVSKEDLDYFSDTITSTETMEAYFKGIHIKLYPDD